MNDNIKGFLGFILGAAISGIAVYIYQDKRLSKKFEEELEAYQKKDKTEEPAITENTNDTNTTETEHNDTPSNDETDSKGDDDMSKNNIPQDALDAVKKMQEGAKKAKEDRENKGEREKNKTNYAKLTRGYASKTLEAVENNKSGDDKMTLSEKIIKNEPYYITQEEFIEMDGKDGYRGVDLFYNADDDSVCNDDGEVLEDAHIMCGWDILQDLYDGKGTDEVYVRNDNFKEVYCISRNFML